MDPAALAESLCASLTPAALVVGDSTNSQFYRALIDLLAADGEQMKRMHSRTASSASCVTCPPPPNLTHATHAAVCGGSVWLSYLRNDWLVTEASFPYPDGGLWHCATKPEQLSTAHRRAVRLTTHLCGPPAPAAMVCGGAPCLAQESSARTRACASVCRLADANFSCGHGRVEPCSGCASVALVDAACRAVASRPASFCASTADGAADPGPDEEHYTAHCAPFPDIESLRQYRVILMNAGAHRVPAATYHQHMESIGDRIRSFLALGAVPSPAGGGARGRVAIFRNTVPGFSGCNATGDRPPFNSVHEAERFYRRHSYYDQYSFVPERNRIAHEYVVRAGGHVIDAYRASIVRVDDRAGMNANGAVDCLHFRSPLLNTSLGAWAALLAAQLLRASSAPRGPRAHDPGYM